MEFICFLCLAIATYMATLCSRATAERKAAETSLAQANDLIRRIGEKIDQQEQERLSDENELWGDHYQRIRKEMGEGL